MEQRTTPLEPTLLWIVTGYRVFAAVWLLILGAVALTEESTDVHSPGFALGTMALVLVWAALATTARVVRPALLTTWWFVAVDLGISCWTVLAGDAAGTIQFAGGYPLVGAFSAIYVYGWSGGAVGAVVLTATGLSRVIGGDESVAQDVANSIAHIFSVGAVAGVAAGLRSSERRRLAAETALEKERTDRIRIAAVFRIQGPGEGAPDLSVTTEGRRPARRIAFAYGRSVTGWIDLSPDSDEILQASCGEEHIEIEA